MVYFYRQNSVEYQTKVVFQLEPCVIHGRYCAHPYSSPAQYYTGFPITYLHRVDLYSLQSIWYWKMQIDFMALPGTLHYSWDQAPYPLVYKPLLPFHCFHKILFFNSHPCIFTSFWPAIVNPAQIIRSCMYIVYHRYECVENNVV